MAPKNEIWTQEAEMFLICYFEERRWLWDCREPQYYRTDMKNLAYEECAMSLGSQFTAAAVEKRWANLKSTFNVNHKKVYPKSGESRDEFEAKVPSWPLYKRLMFLSGTIKQRDTKCSIKKESLIINSPSNTGTAASTSTKEVWEDFEFVEKEVAPESMEAGTAMTVMNVGSATKTKKRLSPSNDHEFYSKKSRGPGSSTTNPVLQSKFDEALTVIKNLGTPEKDSDEHDHFGCVVASALRNMNSLSCESAKMDIQKVLFQYHRDNPNNPYK